MLGHANRCDDGEGQGICGTAARGKAKMGYGSHGVACKRSLCPTAASKPFGQFCLRFVARASTGFPGLADLLEVPIE